MTDPDLLRALRRQPVSRTPVWFMRQAGRSLPEYRTIKQRHSLLEICRRPELCAEVTLQPVRRLGVDAAILYADIILPLVAAGMDIEIVEGVGPVVAEPVRSVADVQRLPELQPEDLDFQVETIRILRRELSVPLLGFAGAPFTLASYLVEGRPSRDFAVTKRLMYAEPAIWDALMTRLAALTATYLRVQAAAGIQAFQLFDSWIGALSPDDYARYVQPYSTQVFRALAGSGLPAIHFGTGTASLLEAMRDAGGDAIGVDWRIPLEVAWDRVGYDRGIQGNLDPAVLLGPWEVVEREARAVLRRAAGRPGHIFNLGHGVLPQTDPDVLKRLVEFVHEATAAAAPDAQGRVGDAVRE